MVSDVLDGYLARRYNATSRLGSILDPATDKIFFLICVGVLFCENSLGLTHLALIFSRDIFLVFFGFYPSGLGDGKDMSIEPYLLVRSLQLFNSLFCLGRRLECGSQRSG